MAGLIRGVPFRQVRPGSASTEHPKDAVENTTTVFPRTPSAVAAARWFGDEGGQNGPLGVGQVAGVRERHRVGSEQDPMELFRTRLNALRPQIGNDS